MTEKKQNRQAPLTDSNDPCNRDNCFTRTEFAFFGLGIAIMGILIGKNVQDVNLLSNQLAPLFDQDLKLLFGGKRNL